MRLRAIKIDGYNQEFVTVGYVNDVYISQDKQAGVGLSFEMPYIFTYRDAAKLAREMEGCIKILDDFINEGQIDRPQIDVIF